MVSASGSETRDSSSTPARAVIYDAYTSIMNASVCRKKRGDILQLKMLKKACGVLKARKCGQEYCCVRR